MPLLLAAVPGRAPVPVPEPVDVTDIGQEPRRAGRADPVQIGQRGTAFGDELAQFFVRGVGFAQARKLVATVKPRDPAGKVRRRLMVELIGELEAIDPDTVNRLLLELLPGGNRRRVDDVSATSAGVQPVPTSGLCTGLPADQNLIRSKWMPS